jgi:hypothetical protein
MLGIVNFGNAEIHQHSRACLGNLDIGGFDIAMDDGWVLGMQVV